MHSIETLVFRWHFKPFEKNWSSAKLLLALNTKWNHLQMNLICFVLLSLALFCSARLSFVFVSFFFLHCSPFVLFVVDGCVCFVHFPKLLTNNSLNPCSLLHKLFDEENNAEKKVKPLKSCCFFFILTKMSMRKSRHGISVLVCWCWCFGGCSSVRSHYFHLNLFHFALLSLCPYNACNVELCWHNTNKFK